MQNLPQSTGLDQINQAVKSNKYSKSIDDLIDAFWDVKMIELIGRVDKEITGVLGEHWTELKR